MMKAIPEPVEALNKQYWRRCAEEKLCFQRCRGCGVWRHIPRAMCARCASMEWEWVQSTGRGKIFSWTVTHAPLHPLFAAEVPYALVLVELEEGVRMISGLRHCKLANLRLELPVEVVFERVAEDLAMPFFQPSV
ncbi:MAG: OB-fold domain-containing protein [Acidobacteria bacterium]|nr:OB-fold domain-containing protein [Acidobacteriota bacterium]